MLVELLVNKSGDTSQIIIKGSISRPIPTVCGHRFPGNQQQIGAESTVGALSIHKRYVYTQLGLEMIRCRTTLKSYRLSQVYCDPTREEVASVIGLNQPIDVIVIIVTCTVTAVVPTLDGETTFDDTTGLTTTTSETTNSTQSPTTSGVITTQTAYLNVPQTDLPRLVP